MNASEKLEFELLAGRYSPLEGYDGFVDKLQKMSDYYTRLKGVLRGVDTYWLSEPLRTVFNHSHNVYIDGGDQAMRYGLGISYNNRDGVMKKSNRDGLGVNIDLSTGKKAFFSRTRPVWISAIRSGNRWPFPNSQERTPITRRDWIMERFPCIWREKRESTGRICLTRYTCGILKTRTLPKNLRYGIISRWNGPCSTLCGRVPDWVFKKYYEIRGFQIPESR